MCTANNEVRLVGDNGFSGWVEVFLEDTWKSTVTQYWTKLEGGVVCRQLGFGGVRSVTHNEASENVNGETKIIFKCEGYELSLLGCEQLDIDDYQDSYYSYVQYFSNSIAQVTCETSAISPSKFPHSFTTFHMITCPDESSNYLMSVSSVTDFVCR